MNKSVKRWFDFYSKGIPARGTDRFQVWAVNQIEKTSVISVEGRVSEWPIHGQNNLWSVRGEIGYDWTEMVEVAGHFNRERDGMHYFVGLPNHPVILKPSWREIKELSNFHAKFPNIDYDFHEKFAFALMIGGDWLNLL